MFYVLKAYLLHPKLLAFARFDLKMHEIKAFLSSCNSITAIFVKIFFKTEKGLKNNAIFLRNKHKKKVDLSIKNKVVTCERLCKNIQDNNA